MLGTEKNKSLSREYPIVEGRNFIKATRDIGYRSLADAVAELVDNSIQAASTQIHIYLTQESDGPALQVLDDGSGMDVADLRGALQFGGTNRFNDRSGLGRFGMGLPCSSISQAKRLDLYSWRRPGYVYHSYLDVDEIAEGILRQIPKPRRSALPLAKKGSASQTGTLVVWRKCERIENNNLVATAQTLRNQLGRMFRYLLWDGIQINVNDQAVLPVDPLFCNPESPLYGAHQYGTSIEYKIRILGKTDETSTVQVRFSELPVIDWRAMPADDKRRFGIVKGAGVSLVRARREIAYGWYFMGDKRKENYDDWWRCEVTFAPELDEYFRPTHTKQEVHPSSELQAILTPDIEALARTLNSRVRESFLSSKHSKHTSSTKLASARDRFLPPLYSGSTVSQRTEHKRMPEFKAEGNTQYSLSIERFREDAFYGFRWENGALELTLNKDHAFFDRIYAPLCTKTSKHSREAIECLLFALIRAEAEAKGGSQQYWYNRKRTAWSNILATFLGR